MSPVLTADDSIRRRARFAFVAALLGAGCLPEYEGSSERGPKERPGPRSEAPDTGDTPDAPANLPPMVEDVRVSPRVPFVDGEVSCDATASDPDGDSVELAYRWENESRGTVIGRTASLTLDPDTIRPGETLRCVVTATDPGGAEDGDSDSVAPGCGYSDEASLRDVDVEVSIVFRPWITDDVIPGYQYEPWDWDGDIPEWLFDFADALATILDVVSDITLDPSVETAAAVAEHLDEVLELIDEYAPELLEDTVPPDPQIYPYLFEESGDVIPLMDVVEWRDWEDTYEIDFRLTGLDLSGLGGLAVDLEDEDLAFNDNMGDLHDHGAMPLVLRTPLFLDGGYCTAAYYNPANTARESAQAYIPGSVLYLSIGVE